MIRLKTSAASCRGFSGSCIVFSSEGTTAGPVCCSFRLAAVATKGDSDPNAAINASIVAGFNENLDSCVGRSVKRLAGLRSAMSLFRDLADDTTRIAGSEHAFWYVPCHYATSTDDCP